MDIVYEFPANERIVSMIQFRDAIIIATTQKVYRITDADSADNVKVEPVKIQRAEDNE